LIQLSFEIAPHRFKVLRDISSNDLLVDPDSITHSARKLRLPDGCSNATTFLLTIALWAVLLAPFKVERNEACL
jgi:hypothetical protein